MKRRSRLGDDRGAVLVEMALIASLLFTLILGTIAFAIDEAGNNSGTNAAREGARRGILYYANADVPGTTNFIEIQNAVRDKLAGLVSGQPAISIACYHANGVALAATGSPSSTCDPSKIVPGSDQLQVTVVWVRLAASPFIKSGSKTDVARMTIVGTPPTTAGGGVTTTTLPGACTLTGASATPSPVTRTGGALNSDVTIAVTVSNIANCGTPLITTIGAAGESANTVPIAMEQVGATTTFNYVVSNDVNNPDNWSDGVKNVAIDPGTAVAPSGACPGATSGGRVCTSFTVGAVCSVVDTSPHIYAYSPSPFTFTVPAGVTSITVGVWGGGGDGALNGGGGGGGGGYSQQTFTSLTPCAQFTGTVDGHGGGGSSSFNGPSTVTANGGANAAGTAGGAAGTGSTASGAAGGGGNGNNKGGDGGKGGGAGGGAGGNGGNGNGDPGIVPGGGGGGAGNGAVGAGADGRVSICWTAGCTP